MAQCGLGTRLSPYQGGKAEGFGADLQVRIMPLFLLFKLCVSFQKEPAAVGLPTKRST